MSGPTRVTFDAWSLPGSVALPPGAAPSFEAGTVQVAYPHGDAAWIRRVAASVEDAGTALRTRRARDVARVVGRVGARFLDPTDPLRARALALLPATSGLSPEMSAAVLDGMATDWTADRLTDLAGRDLGSPGALDGFVPGPSPTVRVHAVGPRLCMQIVSGSVPGVSATALVRSLLVKGPTVIKPGRGDVVLPVLFLEALRQDDPALADAAAVLYWPGGMEAVEKAALEVADVVTAYGGDGVVRSLRDRTPVATRFVAYPHRVSLGVVGRDALAKDEVHRTACAVAGAVSFFDQRGCVSPQAIYVEAEGDADPAAFARELAEALDAVEERLPAGELDAAEASHLHQERGTAELRAASGEGVEVHHGDRASWTVIYDPSPAFGPTCVGRVVRVKPVADAGVVPELVAPLGPHLQTVGVAGLAGRREELARELARVGVSRVAAFDAVPFPPPAWHHDGQGPLAALVRWVDLEDGKG